MSDDRIKVKLPKQRPLEDVLADDIKRMESNGAPPDRIQALKAMRYNFQHELARVHQDNTIEDMRLQRLLWDAQESASSYVVVQIQAAKLNNDTAYYRAAAELERDYRERYANLLMKWKREGTE